jgi:parvulin-like peptidyl-prolyl isomerase
MKTLFRLVFAFTLLFSGQNGVWSEVVSRVVAEVNGDIITSQELDQIIRPLYAKYKSVYSGEELEKRVRAARKNAIDQLIERKLVLQEAKKKNIQVDVKDVETKLGQIKSKFDSDEEFYYALEKEGMTVDQLRENINEQLLVRTLTRQEVTRSISVSPKEVDDYYKKHIDDYSEPEMVQIGQILVKKGKDAQAARKKIEEALAKLKKGEAFEAVAKEYSEGPFAKEGGNLPFYAKGDLLTEIEQASFSLSVGEKSDIIESSLGFHIIVLKAKKEPHVRSLTEVWSEVEEVIYQKEIEQVHKKWVARLKSKAHIQIY